MTGIAVGVAVGGVVVAAAVVAVVKRARASAKTAPFRRGNSDPQPQMQMTPQKTAVKALRLVPVVPGQAAMLREAEEPAPRNPFSPV